MKTRTNHTTKKVAAKQPFKFSWTTPERRIGDKVLPLIANEVYLAIFDHFEPEDNTDWAGWARYRTILSNLALVCRFFCAASLPRIFRSMEYSGLAHGEQTPSYIKFCRELVAGDETASYLGQYVKECTVTHWMQAVEKGQWVFANFLKVYVKSITWLVNLETLRLHDTPIDLKFLAGLGALEKLRSLSISRCEFQFLTKDDKCSAPPLRLTHFELHSHRNGALLAPLSRIITSSCLRTLNTDNWSFLRAVMSQTVDFSIETLTIPIYTAEIVHLQDFLDKTPSIIELSISYVPSIRSYDQLPYPILDLRPSSLPRLSRLECPTCLISDLVPGRPLKSIRINSRVLDSSPSREDIIWDEKRTLSVLKRSTAPITTLRVSGDVYTTASFDQIFPQLDTLILDIPPAIVHPKVIDNICTKWPRSPPVQSLHLCCWTEPTWNFDLSVQLSIVSGIASAFPTLILVRITDGVEWRRHHVHDGVWHPSIIRGRKGALRAMLEGRLNENTGSLVKDHNGCFSTLFDPASINDEAYLRHLGTK